METGIKIGNSLEKTTSDNLKDIITTVFKIGAETRMEQDTIIEALKLIGRITEVHDISLSGANITGDRVINVPA